jgi:serine/threonine-protein kinase
MVAPGNEPHEGEAPPLPAGARLGKYVIVRLLGAGGMGSVYEATHSEIGKRVAVKILSPSIAAVPGARTRFLREAQLTTRVRHPHIVDVTDMGTDDGRAYLVMEFLSGEDLGSCLDRRGTLPPEELVDVMLPVCAAVGAAHQAGITHRDLKPQNIFLVAEGRRVHPKVLDFGISKGHRPGDGVGSGTLTATGVVIGTPYYLAPEQIVDSRAAGPASDQYALGVILYECLTGERPFRADSMFIVFQKIVEGHPRPPRELAPSIPLGLEDVVLRAMLREPRERFESVEAFGRALLPFASSRARLIWEEVFGSPSSALPAPGAAAASSESVPATQEYAPAAGVASSSPDVAGELRAVPGRGRWIALAGVVALAAIGAFLALRGPPAAPAAARPVPAPAPSAPPLAAPTSPVPAPPPTVAPAPPAAPAPRAPALGPVAAPPAAPVPAADTTSHAAAPRPPHKPRGHGKTATPSKTGVPVVD